MILKFPCRLIGRLTAVCILMCAFGHVGHCADEPKNGVVLTPLPVTFESSAAISGDTRSSAADANQDGHGNSSSNLKDCKPLVLRHLINRPLKSIRLADAVRSETLTRDPAVQPVPLGEPVNCAAISFGLGFGAAEPLADTSPVPIVRRPNRNLYPIWYKPLYFEDPNMERCGQGFGVWTEAVSAFRFVGRVPLVPYMMGSQPPCQCVRALPDCPTCQRFGCEAYIPGPSLEGIAAEEFAVLGLIFLIP